MKKIAMGLFLLVMFMAIGCQESGYDYYMKAENKTDDLISGKEKIVVEVQNDFSNFRGDRDYPELTNFETINIEIEGSYQKEDVAMDFYFRTKKTGMDWGFYKKEELAYLKLPIIEKYLDLGELMFSKEEMNLKSGENGVSKWQMDWMSQEKIGKIFSAVRESYIQLIKTKDVSKLEDIKLETPEGLVKVKTFEVFLDETSLMVLKEEIYKAIKNNIEVEKEMLPSVERFFQNLTLQDFRLKAYIDHDDIIIKEEMNFDIISEHKGKKAMSKVSFCVEKWDSNQKVMVFFPEVKESDRIDKEDLKNLNTFKWRE